MFNVHCAIRNRNVEQLYCLPLAPPPPPPPPRRDAMHMFVTQLDVAKEVEESFHPVYKALDAVDRVDEYQRFIQKHRQ